MLSDQLFIPANVTDRMETLPESLRRRMPKDLREYLKSQVTLTNIAVCEQEPTEIACEEHSGKIKAYFPAFPSDPTVVFVHFPGGKPKAVHASCRR